MNATKKKLLDYPLAAFGLVLILSLGLLLFFGIGCDPNRTTDLRIYSFVNSYCIGQNGILLTGPLAACCSYSNVDLTNATSETAISGKISQLKGTLLSPPPPSINCPGPLSDVVVEIGGVIAAQNSTVQALIASINSLGSGSGIPSAAGINGGNASPSPTPTNFIGGNQVSSIGPQGSSAATATTNPVTPNLPVPSLTSAPLAPGGGGSGGGAGSGNSSSASGSSSGGTTSAATEASTVDPGGLLPTGGSTYRAGEGGNRRGSADSSSNFFTSLFGMSGSGGGPSVGGSEKEISFKNASSLPQENIEDPENYFERTAPDASLFKEIHEKYLQKSPSLL